VSERLRALLQRLNSAPTSKISLPSTDGAEEEQPLRAADGRERRRWWRHRGPSRRTDPAGEAGTRAVRCDFGALDQLPRDRCERLVEHQPQSQPTRAGLLRATHTGIEPLVHRGWQQRGSHRPTGVPGTARRQRIQVGGIERLGDTVAERHLDWLRKRPCRRGRHRHLDRRPIQAACLDHHFEMVLAECLLEG
jgi:hypothetical protein